ncbi:MAG TPA: hypothetical protein VE931_04865 [Pyrinomonadaceae bacterium]|nr:hypothetical protein [Pyrinomonadaceae bacterium]
MSDTIKNITIGHTKPDTPELIGCYFEWVAEVGGLNVYNFYDSQGQLRVGNLRVGDPPFNFVLPQSTGMVWVLNITGGSDTFVGGNWSSLPIHLPIGDVVPEPDQSYQAQAGITPVYEESTVAASATA